MRFDDYMNYWLYDPTVGFYTSGRGVAGRRSGDFITSPEVGPLFGTVLANAIDRWAREVHSAPPRMIVDAGAGPGSLLKAIETSGASCVRHTEFIAVDPALGTELPDDLSGCVVIANELLDNMAFRIVERGPDGWLEVYVDDGVETLEPLAQVETALPPALVHLGVGQRAPWHEEAAAWVVDVLARGCEWLIVFDYGAATTAELASRGGWLRTYRAHQRGDDPYFEPGQWDITADVGFDQLPPPTSLRRQGEQLQSWGIERLVDEGKNYWQAHASAPDLFAMKMRSRVAEVEALTDPDALGGFYCLQWQRP